MNIIKWTYDAIVVKLKEFGFSLLDDEKDFSNIYSKHNIIDENGYKYNCTFYHLFCQKEHKPAIVGRGNPYSLDNIKLWIQENNKSFELISNSFISARDPLDFICSECKTQFQRSWNDIKSKQCGCRKCRYEKQKALQRRPKGNGKRLSEIPYLLSDFDYERNDGSPNDYSWKSGRYVNWKCHICGYTWRTMVSHRSKDKSGCPKCANKMSKAELEISRLLNESNVVFEQEKCFIQCKDKHCLPFDFYLPNNNTVIEYDGEQHYHPVEFNKITIDDAKIAFEKTILHDNIKNKYCQENGIALIRIPFWEKDNIEIILKENGIL